MKKTLVTLILTTFVGNAFAFNLDSYMSPSTQKIVLPCTASIAIGAIMGEIGAGLAVCGGVATYQVIDNRNSVDEQRIKGKFDAQTKLIDSKIQDMSEKHLSDYKAHREAIREIVVEKFAGEGKETSDLVKAYINSSEFEALLRQKTIELLNSSEEVLSKRLKQIAEEIELRVTRNIENTLTLGEQ